MKKIFLDLEMNDVKHQNDETEAMCSREVIEFGAVMLNEKNDEIDRFQCYVRPTYSEKIASHISRLTGINTEQIFDADDFQEAFLKFLCWCGDDYEIYSWSENDERQLRNEYSLKVGESLPEIHYLFSNWKDLQKLYGDLFEFKKPTALPTAINTAGIDFHGRMHTALVDALATADLYREMACGSTIRKLKADFTEAKKPIGTCLGDLFLNLQIA